MVQNTSMFKKSLIFILVFSLLSITPVTSLAAETATQDNRSTLDKGADWIEDWNKGDKGVHREIARPISKEILKRSGQPGFFISKYLNYRKLISAPQCTTSQKLSYYANLLTLAGDVVLNVLTWKQTKDLKKEFEGKISELENYSKENDLTKVKEKSVEKPDVQLMAFDYAIKKDEQELQRLNLMQYFKYPALAMHLTATIMNAQEALAETSSLGTAVAAANACMTAQQPQKKVETVATDAKTDAAPTNVSGDEAPWYLKPFIWISDKVKSLKDSSFAKGGKAVLDARREYTRGMDTGKQKEEYSYSDASGAIVSGMGPVNSAAYAEEMIVGVISHLKKPSQYAKNKVLNKIGQDLEVMAIRYAVRKMVKLNIEAVDKFMRSSVGRAVVYAYNIWVIYTEFDGLRDQIQAAKDRIAKLKEIRSKLGGATAWHFPSFKENSIMVAKLTAWLLASEAQAEFNPSGPYSNLKFCLGTDSCSISQTLVDQVSNDHYSKLPVEVQKAQKELITTSYTLRQMSFVMNGKMSVTDLDLGIINKEIDRNKNLVEQYYKVLGQRGILKKEDLARYENKFLTDDFNAYSGLMREDFNSQTIYASSSIAGLVPFGGESVLQEKAKVNEANTQQVQGLEQKQIPASKEEARPTGELIINTIHGGDGDLWLIIHNRYLKHFEGLGEGK